MNTPRAPASTAGAASPGAERASSGRARPSDYPRRRANVRARAVAGEVVILDRQRHLVHQLNQTASYIWDRCDGQHGLGAIARDLAEAFDVDLAVAEHDVAEVIRRLDGAGLVEQGRPERRHPNRQGE